MGNRAKSKALAAWRFGRLTRRNLRRFKRCLGIIQHKGLLKERHQIGTPLCKWRPGRYLNRLAKKRNFSFQVNRHKFLWSGIGVPESKDEDPYVVADCFCQAPRWDVAGQMVEPGTPCGAALVQAYCSGRIPDPFHIHSREMTVEVEHVEEIVAHAKNAKRLHSPRQEERIAKKAWELFILEHLGY